MSCLMLCVISSSSALVDSSEAHGRTRDHDHDRLRKRLNPGELEIEGSDADDAELRLLGLDEPGGRPHSVTSKVL